MEASLLCFSSVFLIVLRVFLLLFYQITEALQQQTQGFRNEKFHIPVIFYADDGLMLANSHQDAEESIQKLMEIARTYGLEIY